jgi:hypothetical protein
LNKSNPFIIHKLHDTPLDAMPLPKIHYAISRMGFIEEGAPWKFPKWQSLTRLSAQGYNPDDDALLPPGVTREEARKMSDYHDQLRAKVGEAARDQFSKAIIRRQGRTGDIPNDSVPGRALWRSFIVKNWARWGVQTTIVEIFRNLSLLPVQNMILNEKEDLDDRSALYLSYALVGEALFGSDVLVPDVYPARLLNIWTPPIQTIIARTYENLKSQSKRTRNRLTRKREDLDALVNRKRV